jgi:hypothetical protein
VQLMGLAQTTEPKVATAEGCGVGAALPHMQDCVYLGELPHCVLQGVSGTVTLYRQHRQSPTGLAPTCTSGVARGGY